MPIYVVVDEMGALMSDRRHKRRMLSFGATSG